MSAIAAMRTRLTLQAPVDTIDDTGALQRVWTPVASLWAALTPRRAAGEFVAAEEGPALMWDVEIRFRADVAAPMRFTLGARILLIRAAFDPDGARRSLLCRCEEYSS